MDFVRARLLIINDRTASAGDRLRYGAARKSRSRKPNETVVNEQAEMSEAEREVGASGR